MLVVAVRVALALGVIVMGALDAVENVGVTVCHALVAVVSAEMTALVVKEPAVAATVAAAVLVRVMVVLVRVMVVLEVVMEAAMVDAMEVARVAVEMDALVPVAEVARVAV